jgi:hypothetical protein
VGECLCPSPFPHFIPVWWERKDYFWKPAFPPPAPLSHQTQTLYLVAINNLNFRSTFYGTLGQVNSKLAQLKWVIRHDTASPISCWTSANVPHYFGSWAGGNRNHDPESAWRRTCRKGGVLSFWLHSQVLGWIREDWLWGAEVMGCQGPEVTVCCHSALLGNLLSDFPLGLPMARGRWDCFSNTPNRCWTSQANNIG